ncbi:MAG: LytTR family DNA-binding domain-containing protein [Cytophagaceae bacterium]|nr:LytTR family DNA-binding domain-containing protein [Cytophagaceae bacterium]
MTILLVEDEPLAAKRLATLLREVAPDAQIVGQTESVRETLRWLDAHPAPDLMLLDIQLADGLSFEIFQQRPINAPVIFTTAYDEYALRAFKVNSVDYLLKPIEKEELAVALDKFRQTRGIPPNTVLTEQLGRMLEAYGVKPVSHKSRFLLRQGGRLEVIETGEVDYLFAEDKVVFLVTTQSRKFIVDETLDELERQLDPNQFFRLNRKYLGRLSAIGRIEPHFNGKLRLWLKHRPAEEEIFVSRERAESFKVWLNG